MKEQTKFKSGLSKYAYWGLLVYHLVMIVAFILPHFLWKNVVSWYGFLLIAIDVLYLFPLLFNTYYSLEEDYLFVFQWPFVWMKIPYDSIFIIDNEFPKDLKKKYTYGFQNKLIVIGYELEVLDKKEKKVSTKKRYVAISPKEYDDFMIKIGGKFSSAKSVAEKLQKTRDEKKAVEEAVKPQENKVVEFVGTLKKKKVKDPVEEQKKLEEKIDQAEEIVVSGSKGINTKIKVIDTEEENK